MKTYKVLSISVKLAKDGGSVEGTVLPAWSTSGCGVGQWAAIYCTRFEDLMQANGITT